MRLQCKCQIRKSVRERSTRSLSKVEMEAAGESFSATQKNENKIHVQAKWKAVFLNLDFLVFWLIVNHTFFKRRMMLKEVFEFDVLDPIKVCTVLSTHLPSLKEVADRSSGEAEVLYSSLLKRLKVLSSGYQDTFTATQAQLKLCEVFTAKVLCSTGIFKNDHHRHYYAPILDIFSNAQVNCDLAYYFRLVHDMSWELFAAYLITEKTAASTNDFFDVALDQLDEDADLSVFMTLTQIKVFRSLLTNSKSSPEEEEEQNPLRIFSLASILVKKSAPEFVHQCEQLLAYSLNIFAQNHLTNSEAIEQLFRQRVALFGTEAIPFGTDDLLANSLISEVAFTRVKLNLQDPKLQRLSLRIILCAFISPLATYDSLLNSLLIFSPLHYNRFVLHLLCHHLRPLSQVQTSIRNVLAPNGPEQNLSLLTALTILKFQRNFDLLSGKSFTDFVQALCLAKGDCGLPFETILANLLAYSSVQSASSLVSLQWLDMIFDLVNSCGGQSPSSSQSQLKPPPKHGFTVVSAFLLKLLSIVWQDTTKKELVSSIIRIYVQQQQQQTKTKAEGRMNKLRPGAARQIEALLRRSSVNGSNGSIHDLLHHLEECFAPPSSER